MRYLSIVLSITIAFHTILDRLNMPVLGYYNNQTALEFFMDSVEQCEDYRDNREIFVDCLRYSAEIAQNAAILNESHRLQNQQPEII